jgi:hypothetical protein
MVCLCLPHIGLILALADIPRIPGLLSAIFRLIEAHRNEIRPQPASFAANRSGGTVKLRGTDYRHAALVAVRHCAAASDRKIRSVDRETRWRWRLKVLWTAA